MWAAQTYGVGASVDLMKFKKHANCEKVGESIPKPPHYGWVKYKCVKISES